jgi:hypothetical protein
MMSVAEDPSKGIYQRRVPGGGQESGKAGECWYFFDGEINESRSIRVVCGGN